MKIRSFPPLLALCSSLLSFSAYADQDWEQHGQISINPAGAAATLTLKGPAYDSSGLGSMALTYLDGTAASPAGTGIFRLFRPAGQYQWQFSNADGSDRLAMTLGNDHSLTLFNPLLPSSTLVLTPGGITIGGVPVLTSASATLAYAPLHPSRLAAGDSSAASWNNSLALGTGVITAVESQAALGRWNVPTASLSDPFVPTATGDLLLVIGNGTSAAARSNVLEVYSDGTTRLKGSLAIGPSLAEGSGTLAGGLGCRAYGDGAVSMGRSNYSGNAGAVTMGNWSQARGECSFALGAGNVTRDYVDTAFGMSCLAEGVFSFAQGVGSVSHGLCSFAAGSSQALGQYSTSLGVGATSSGYGQVAVGRFNVAEGVTGSVAQPAPGEKLFVVGNGMSETARSDAFVVKNNGDVDVKGVLRVAAAGDLSMGLFTAGAHP